MFPRVAFCKQALKAARSKQVMMQNSYMKQGHFFNVPGFRCIDPINLLDYLLD